jgi:YD repeat-containing protein
MSSRPRLPTEPSPRPLPHLERWPEERPQDPGERTGLFTQLDGTLAQRTITINYAYEDDDPGTPPANDGLLRKVVDPLNHTRQLSYDARGNVLTITDPLNRTTINTYYPATNLVETTTDAAGHVTSFTYDVRGMLDKETRTVTVLDETGATRIDTIVTDHDYDPAGYLVRMVDPLGHETTYENDFHGESSLRAHHAHGKRPTRCRRHRARIRRARPSGAHLGRGTSA